MTDYEECKASRPVRMAVTEMRLAISERWHQLKNWLSERWRFGG